MKTNMTISVDGDLKQKVQLLAKKSGTNLSTLVNMYFAHVVNTGECHFVLDSDA
jgi:antitoxin component of RelBE/YafQ-DinJ toxin-antitoxin module